MLSSRRRPDKALRCTEAVAPDCSASAVDGEQVALARVAGLAVSGSERAASGEGAARLALREQMRTRTTSKSPRAISKSAAATAATGNCGIRILATLLPVAASQVESSGRQSAAPSGSSHEAVGELNSGVELPGGSHTTPGSHSERAMTSSSADIDVDNTSGRLGLAVET